ncbi:RDD family protein [Spongiactinospora sp. 9N601]|uniref:RDD family protein n=1 Tax=Spongiactinospora sp. 9N601 TaxID=3375149 RepID=UPI0037BB3907
MLVGWGVAAAVAGVPTWEVWRERWEIEEVISSFESVSVYGMVCPFNSGTSLSPLAPLHRDLEVVMEIVVGWAVPVLVVLVGLVAVLRGRDLGVTARRVAGLLVVGALMEPVASLYSVGGMCQETVPLFSADWFREAAGGWGIGQGCLLGAAALVFVVGERGESQGGVVWRRAAAGLVDYLVIVSVLSVGVGVAWPLIDSGFWMRMGAGLLERAEGAVAGGRVKPEELALLGGVFLYFWVQHAVWGRTLGKRLMGVQVVAAFTGGRLSAGRAALRALAFPLLGFVPGVGLWCLVVVGLWMLVDPEGRVLHDRWLGAAVVRGRVREIQPEIQPEISRG